jgi:hypothetical protein
MQLQQAYIIEPVYAAPFALESTKFVNALVRIFKGASISWEVPHHPTEKEFCWRTDTPSPGTFKVWLPYGGSARELVEHMLERYVFARREQSASRLPDSAIEAGFTEEQIAAEVSTMIVRVGKRGRGWV